MIVVPRKRHLPVPSVGAKPSRLLNPGKRLRGDRKEEEFAALAIID